MKFYVKFITQILFLLFTFQVLNAQEADKTISLVVSSQGKTQEEAKQNALRSAIEQAFGTFISSNTEVLNDSLVRDEIVSVTNGNIQSFDIISEVKIPEGIAITLKAIVSINKLNNFCQSKGFVVEFKGGLFAANIKQQILNENAEYEAIKNICKVSINILKNAIEFNLKVDDPISTRNLDIFSIPINVHYNSNMNKKTFYNFFKNSLKAVSMLPEEHETYNKLKKSTYSISFEKDNESNEIGKLRIGDGLNDFISIGNIFYLRNPKSLLALKNFIFQANNLIDNFVIYSEIDTFFLQSSFKHNSNFPLQINYTDYLINCFFYEGDFDFSSDGYLNTNKLWYSTGHLFLYFLYAQRSDVSHIKKYFTNDSFLNIDENTIKNMINSDIGYRSSSNEFKSCFNIFFYGNQFTNGRIYRGFHNEMPTFEYLISLNKIEKISKFQIMPVDNSFFFK